MRPPTPSRLARLRAGLTAKQAARSAGVTTRHLLQLERTQEFGYSLASVLARCYSCSMLRFLPSPTLTGPRGARGKAGRPGSSRQGSPAVGRGREARS
jgi:hypothetical protein